MRRLMQISLTLMIPLYNIKVKKQQLQSVINITGNMKQQQTVDQIFDAHENYSKQSGSASSEKPNQNTKKVKIVVIILMTLFLGYRIATVMKDINAPPLQQDIQVISQEISLQQRNQPTFVQEPRSQKNQEAQNNQMQDSETQLEPSSSQAQHKQVDQQPFQEHKMIPQQNQDNFQDSTASPSQQNQNNDELGEYSQQKQQEKSLEQEYYEEVLNFIKPLRAPHLKLKQPELYLDTFKVLKSKQLPFCIIIRNINSAGELEEILDSIQGQSFTNYHVAYSGLQELEIDLGEYRNKITYSDVDENEDKNQVYAVKKIMEKGCDRDSIVVPLRQKMKERALKKLNLLYQRQNIWLTYDAQLSKNYSSVNSFYYQVFDQITFSMIRKSPQNYFQLELEKFAASLLHLTKYHAEFFPIDWLYQEAPHKQGISFYYGQINLTLKPYNQNAMMYLQPNSQPQEEVVRYFNKMNSLHPPQNKYRPRNKITLPMMLKALQYTSLKILPKNHTLFDRQILQFQQKYQLSKYKKQVSLCVIVMGRDNIEDNRYRKVLKTIKQQNYTNYHIIFIDDASTDETFEKSEEYIKQIGLFDRVDMIKNDKQMFATYNIQNAIHNYCQEKQVAVLVDGDDQLLGTQVFKLINYGYQEKQNWIVYFSFFSTIYMYGVSQEPKPQFFQNDEPRQEMKVIGALRTFYVDLYRKIQMEDHKDNDGQFFDRLYDDAMQHPLLQMSGLEHTRYIPEVVYFYNQDYGRNDGTTEEGRQDWKRHQREILTRQKYTPLQSLF